MKVKQYRCNISNSSSDVINNLQPDELSSNIFGNVNWTVNSLSIQTIPGVRFSLNDSGWVIIGATGYYEINPNGMFKISSLKFSDESANLISNSQYGYVLVDVTYEEVGN